MRNIIDFHHHWMPREHVDHPEPLLRPGETIREVVLSDGQRSKRIVWEGMALITVEERRYFIDQRLKDMEEANVSAAIFTMATWQSFMVDLPTCQFVNDEMAKAIQDHPKQLVGAAHLPLSPARESANELERAIKELGFRAMGIVTNVNGVFPDNEAYYPLYEVAEAYNVPVIVHCAASPADDFSMREYDLSRTVGREVDHTLAVVRLFRSQVLDRFPNLTFVHGHLGGTFFMSTFRYGREEGGIESRTIEQGKPELSREALRERIKNFYFTTTFWEPRAIQYAVESLGSEHIVFGSDYPIRTRIMSEIAAAIESLDISQEAKDNIAYKNAQRIFGAPFPG